MKTRNNEWTFPNKVLKIFLVFILVLFVRYAYLAISPVIDDVNLKKFASNRNTVSSIITAKRGTIYDNSNNTLALDVSSYTVVAYLDESRTGSSPSPKHVVDKKATADALAPLLNMTSDYILKLLNYDVYQIELGPGGRGITELVKNKIEELNLPGIGFIEGYKRYYPNGDFASYIVGYAKNQETTVDINGVATITNTIVGELGIEYKYDEMLKGINGSLEYQKDRYGYKLPDTPEINKPAKDGYDVYLTIDSNIQRLLEEAIKNGTEKYKPAWFTINIMDAKTGDILASSSTPSYDPNVLEIVNYENPLTSFQYEPGSIMKVYTYMCAIEKGTYKGNDTFLSGSLKVADTMIYDWNRSGWGTISYDVGFGYSSNVGTTLIGQNFLTKEELRKCFSDYGFGSQTGIELPRELAGSIKFNYPVEVATATFGQGVFTTPIQHLQALSIIANNGSKLKPHIISKIVDPKTGKAVYERQVEATPMVKQSTVDYMKQLMWNVVNDKEHATTGSSYYMKDFDLIGKTGTGEIFDNATGKYMSGWNEKILSFSGIFPKDDPDIIILASIREPNNGSNTSIAETIKPLIKSIAQYRGVYNDTTQEKPKTSFVLDSYLNKDINLVKEELTKQNLNVVVIGNGTKVINQYPASKNTVLTNDKIYLLTNDLEIKMPDFKGMSKIEAVGIMDMLNIKYVLDGYGTVDSQSITKDSIINREETITLTLTKKYEKISKET